MGKVSRVYSLGMRNDTSYDHGEVFCESTGAVIDMVSDVFCVITGAVMETEDFVVLLPNINPARMPNAFLGACDSVPSTVTLAYICSGMVRICISP
jgi:hypothetical protein